MEQARAESVVAALRQRGVFAHLARAGVYQFGVRVVLPDGREAMWDTDGTASLEAQVMRDGMLVGFVPKIPASADFDEAAIIEAIANADYDAPVVRSRPAHPTADPSPPRAAPAAAVPPAPRGLLDRLKASRRNRG